MKTRAAALVAALALAAVAPPLSRAADGSATPRAPDIDVEHPCYVDGEGMMLSGSGFIPGGDVTLRLGGFPLGSVFADGYGDFDVRVVAPPVVRAQRLAITARDRGRPGAAASALVRITPIDVRVAPATAAPARRRRIAATGFIDVGALYAHLRRRGGAVRTIHLGRPGGPCGTLTVRRRLFRAGARTGIYDLQFDALQRLVPGVSGSVGYVVAVFRTVAAGASSAATGP